MGLAGFWSVAGLVVLASASWWVALREMGDGGFYLKRQAIWLLASWSLLGITISTNLRRWLRWSGPGLWMGCLLIAATLVMGTTKGFTSSEGCICSGPSTSQRLAPFTVVPITRVAAINRQPIHSPGPDQRSQRRRLVEIVMPSKLQLAISQMACRLR